MNPIAASLFVQGRFRRQGPAPEDQAETVQQLRQGCQNSLQRFKDMAANSCRKQIIVSSLCRHFKLNPEALSAKVEKSDVMTLYSDILKLSANGPSSSYNEEITKWIAFAEEFLANSEPSLAMLQKLNEDLAPISVLLGKGFKISEADVIVFSAIHAVVAGPLGTDAQKLPHLMRWMDYIQNKEYFEESLQKITVEKAAFIPFVAKPVAKAEDDSISKKNVQNTKSAGKSEEEKPAKNSEQTAKKSDSAKKTKVEGEAKQEKKKMQEPVAAGKDEVSVSLLNIQVGHIRKAWKHPSADSLLVEEIDVGEGKVRQVVSGLAKFCSPEELTNRLVVVITNVKPGKLRDVMSEGLVLCASNEDHSVVEPLLSPQGAKIGESVVFSGIDGKPEDVLNPKKKQLDKITPHLFTDDKGVATYKGIPFMTSAGPCTSSIPKATVK